MVGIDPKTTVHQSGVAVNGLTRPKLLSERYLSSDSKMRLHSERVGVSKIILQGNSRGTSRDWHTMTIAREQENKIKIHNKFDKLPRMLQPP